MLSPQSHKFTYLESLSISHCKHFRKTKTSGMRNHYSTVYLSKFTNIREGWICSKEIKDIGKSAERFNCPIW